LGVVDDRDFEQRLRRILAAEQLLGEKGEVGDVVDDGLVLAWVTRPPAFRMIGASPRCSPRTIEGSTRWSRQLTTIT
jgi:hypothetical protein